MGATTLLTALASQLDFFTDKIKLAILIAPLLKIECIGSSEMNKLMT